MSNEFSTEEGGFGVEITCVGEDSGDRLGFGIDVGLEVGSSVGVGVDAGGSVWFGERGSCNNIGSKKINFPAKRTKVKLIFLIYSKRRNIDARISQ